VRAPHKTAHRDLRRRFTEWAGGTGAGDPGVRPRVRGCPQGGRSSWVTWCSSRWPSRCSHCSR